MANILVAELYEFIFQKVMLGVPSGYTTYNPTDAELAALFSSILDVDVSDKMALVPSATVANFAAFDADGQVYDSNKNASSFAPLSHNHDARYLRLDAVNNYDATASTGHRFTWQVSTEAPFDIDNTSGDILDVVTYLNADLLDGKHASEFAKQDHSHAAYVAIAGTHTITGTYTFDRAGTGVAPFAVAADNNGVVANLNAALLGGIAAAGFATAGHEHSWGDIIGTLSDQTDLQTVLDTKMTLHGGSTYVAGIVPKYNGTDNNIISSGLNITDLATVTQLAAKYDEIAATTGNFASFGSSGATLTDSSVSAADFAAASHDHDSRYFTETELTNGTTNLNLAALTLGETTAAGATTGTLATSPTAGNPSIWFVIHNGAGDYAIPGWRIP